MSEMKNMLAITLCICFFTCIVHVNSQNCTKINQCQCQFDDGDFLDLHPLDSGTQNYSSFQNIHAQDGDWYSWNPCTPFCEVHCEGAAVCQNVSKTDDLYYTCGKHDETTFRNGYQYWNGSEYMMNITGLVLEYKYYDNSNMRSSIVKLNCDEGIEGKLEAYGEYLGHYTMHYFFNFTSKYVCPQRNLTNMTAPLNVTCPHPWETTTTSTTKLTTESTLPTTIVTSTAAAPDFPLTWGNLVMVLLLGIAILFVCYCIVGVAINACRGRTGSELVPHTAFWKTCCCCGSDKEPELRPLIDDCRDTRDKEPGEPGAYNHI